jgi:hypothetical protein
MQAVITISAHNVPLPEAKVRLDNIQHCYNDAWSCPLTPFENRVKVAVRAGERVFPNAAHE